MRVYPCASSSKGNMFLVCHNEQYIIIDGGIAGTHIYNHCTSLGGSLSQLQGVFVTHAHGDHCAGLEVFYNKYEKQCPQKMAPIFAHRDTLEAICRKHKKLQPRCHAFQQDTLTVGSFRVTAFQVPHDVYCQGYIVSCGEGDEKEVLVLALDVGHIFPNLLPCLSSAHLLILEANYDPSTLHHNPNYSYSEKQRITGHWGHLSNEESAWLVTSLASQSQQLHTVIFAHLSQENNSPSLVEQALYPHSEGVRLPEIIFAPVKSPLASYEVKEHKVVLL